MKKLFLLLSFFCLIGCKENTYIIGQAQQQKAAYTVNVYDDKGDWYETGLLIESLDNKMFVQINDGRHELGVLLRERGAFRGNGCYARAGQLRRHAV